MVMSGAYSPRPTPLQYSIAHYGTYNYGLTWHSSPFLGVYKPLVALCSLVFDSNQTKTRRGAIEQVNQEQKAFLNSLCSCVYHLYRPGNLGGILLCYWRQISMRKRLDSVNGCLPSALEVLTGFLEVVPTSASFFNSQSKVAQTQLTWICCARFIKRPVQ